MFRPVVEDDGWSGALSYQWTQISGPAGPTIVSPTELWTEVIFPETAGVYVFQIVVTRADDSLSGVGYWRAVVYTDAALPAEVLNNGPVTLEVNGSPFAAQIESTNLNEEGFTDNCDFTILGYGIQVFNTVTITRGAKRLFGGIALSVRNDNPGNEGVIFEHVNLVGFGWHLGRKRVTKVYSQVPAHLIVEELLSLAPGGITPDFVQQGLPSIDITIEDLTIGEAIAKVAEIVNAHHRVDYFAQLHFALIEPEGDPLPLTAEHPSMKNLSVTRDGSQTANRVTVHYSAVRVVDGLANDPPIRDRVEIIPQSGEIEVESLDGYSLAGGVTEVDGNLIRYQSLIRRVVTNYQGTSLRIDTTGVEVTDGELSGDVLYNYYLTLVTDFGETPPIWGQSSTLPLSGGQNAIKLQLKQITAGPSPYSLDGLTDLSRIQVINVYSTTGLGASDGTWLGTINPRGGHFTDSILPANRELFPTLFESGNEAGEQVRFFLGGCSIIDDPVTDRHMTRPVPASVTVNDVDSQEDLAERLGEVGDDAGVIEVSLNAGQVTDEEALSIATAFLGSAKNIAVSVGVQVRDDNAHPGQTLSMNMPAPFDVADVKIQTVQVKGFEQGVAHESVLTAAVERIKFEALLPR